MQTLPIFLGLGHWAVQTGPDMMGAVFAAAMTNLVCLAALAGMCCLIWDKVTKAGK